MNDECPICYELITSKDVEGLFCFTCNNLYCSDCINKSYFVEQNICAICRQTLKLDEDEELSKLINISLEKNINTYTNIHIVYYKIAKKYLHYNLDYASDLFLDAYKLGLDVPCYEIADKFHQNNILDKALLWYQLIPEDKDACIKMAMIYESYKFNKLAFKWYFKAGKLGGSESAWYIGKFYYKQKKYINAKEWYVFGERIGDPKSINSLALLYAEGIGVEKDISQAISILKKHSYKSKEIMINLGKLYLIKGCKFRSKYWFYKSKIYKN